eukprot:12508492-Alexandrium_andersonii.AAC.1
MCIRDSVGASGAMEDSAHWARVAPAPLRLLLAPSQPPASRRSAMGESAPTERLRSSLRGAPKFRAAPI